MSAGLLNTIVAVFTLAGLAWLLYRPKVQKSRTYVNLGFADVGDDDEQEPRAADARPCRYSAELYSAIGDVP